MQNVPISKFNLFERLRQEFILKLLDCWLFSLSFSSTLSFHGILLLFFFLYLLFGVMHLLFLSFKVCLTPLLPLLLLFKLDLPLFLLILGQKVLSGFHLNILQPGSRLRRERSVFLLLKNFLLFLLELNLLKFGKEFVPVLLLHIFVFHQLPFNH
jgi:hypothetical protein